MPVNTRSGGRNINFEKEKENCANGEMVTPLKPSLNLPHLTKFFGHINEDPDRFFMLFEHLASLQQWDNTKRKELLPMYLQDTALDLVFQLKLQNLVTETTYAELKDKLVSLCRPKIPLYKAEIELNAMQQHIDERAPIFYGNYEQ